MNNCYRCIMEHGDGVVLVNPSIYNIEGDYYNVACPKVNKDDPEQECEEGEDCPF